MDIPGALTGISTALTIAKQLKEIDARIDESTFKLKIAELTAALAEAKLGLIDAQEALREKDAELSTVHAKLKFKAEETTRYEGMTYDVINGEPIGVPYCPVCVEAGVFITLVQHLIDPGMPWKCPKCKADMQNVSTFQR